MKEKKRRRRGSNWKGSSSYVAGRHDSHGLIKCDVHLVPLWLWFCFPPHTPKTPQESMEQERITKDDNALS